MGNLVSLSGVTNMLLVKKIQKHLDSLHDTRLDSKKLIKVVGDSLDANYDAESLLETARESGPNQWKFNPIFYQALVNVIKAKLQK